MAINKVPTLLLGLGGIGCRIANYVNAVLTEDEKRYVGIVGLDTNAEDLKKLNILPLRTSDNKLVREYLEQHPEYCIWFPVNEFTVNRTMDKGAGQIRAISRLAALGAIERGTFRILDNEIKRILAHQPDVDSTQFNVFIVGSITGGTGAGIFLQMPFYIKNQLKYSNAISSIRCRGMFISADITKEVQNSEINRNAVMVNAFACMKELNAFYLTQTAGFENNLEMEYYERRDRSEEERILESQITDARRQSRFGIDENRSYNMSQIHKDAKAMVNDRSNIPYDAFYLIEGTDNGGSTGSARLESIEKQVAKMIYTMLFTPLEAQATGVEDNFILQDMEGGGMNRYSSAGLCSLEYPYAVMQDYVTARWVQDIVQQEWLCVDERFETEHMKAVSLRKSNPSYQVPKMEEKYISLFEDESGGGEGKKLGTLREQAFFMLRAGYDSREDGDESGRIVSEENRAIAWLDMVRDEVDKIMNSSAIEELEDQYEVPKAENIQRNSVISILEGLDSLRKTVDQIVKDANFRMADEFFAPNQIAYQTSRPTSKSIITLLKEVHPIVGRYFCYVLERELKKNIRDLEGDLVSQEALNSYKKENYYKEKRKKHSKRENVEADEAADRYRQIKNPIKRRRCLKRFRKTLQEMVRSQKELVMKYGTNEILLSTYRQLLERVELLAQCYEGFFNNIRKHIAVNNERVNTLERSYVDDPLGHLMVYAKPENFRSTYTEFRKRSTSYDLPREATASIADGLMKIALVKVEQKDTFDNEYKKREWEEINADQLYALFHDAVIETLKTQVISRGKGLVDISCKEALEKEFLKENTSYIPDTEYDSRRLAHEIKRVEAAMRMAVPMFAVEGERDITETVYMAIHPLSAEKRGGIPDKDVTGEKLFSKNGSDASDNQPVCVLMDEDFSPYEIICFKAKHKYMIENLTKYRKDSEYAKAYKERIRSLGTTLTDNSKDSFKTVVNPHLDRYWHEIGFIPEFGDDNMKTAVARAEKAFFYGLGWNLFEERRDEYDFGKENPIKLWHYEYGERRDKLALVTKAGAVIGHSYVELYESMTFGCVMVERIMEFAIRAVYAEKGELDSDTLLDRVADMVLVMNLAGTSEGSKNVLNILATMRGKMPVEKWDAMFVQFSDVLFEYLKELFGQNDLGKNEAYDKAVKYIYSCSHAKEVYDQHPNEKLDDIYDLSIGEKEIIRKIPSIAAIRKYS